MTAGNSELGEQLRLLVRREYDLLCALLDVMATERDLLLHGGELGPALLDKQNLLAQLETATQTRMQWLRREGIPAKQSEMRKQLDALDETGALAQEITAFEAAALECRQRNTALSPIIRRRHLYLDRAATSLGLGIDSSETSYSSSGRSLAGSAPRHLGIA